MAFVPQSAIGGAEGIGFPAHDGVAKTGWFASDVDGVVWVPRSWLCAPTNAPKYISTEWEEKHPMGGNMRIVPVTGEIDIVTKDTRVANEIRGRIAEFKASLGTTVTSWVMRKRAVEAIRSLPSEEAVRMAIDEAGFTGILGTVCNGARESWDKHEFCVLHVEAIKTALEPVAKRIGTQHPLGRHDKEGRERILNNLVINGKHWSQYLCNIRNKSVTPGGTRDAWIISLVRRWNLWRPHVIDSLPEVHTALSNHFVGRLPLAKVLCVDSADSVIPENPSLVDLVRGGAVILSLRAMLKWKKSTSSGEKNVDNSHLRAMFTTEKGGGGDGSANPASYSLMYAVKRAFPSHREMLDALDFYHHVVCEGFPKRLELAPIPKRIPHPLTWMWYCVNLERLFWERFRSEGNSFKSADVLRITIMCQLSGTYISPMRSEEPSLLVMPGRACPFAYCRAPDCHSNRVVLDSRPGYSRIEESHGKWEGSSAHAHEIALPESLANLFREWFGWARGVIVGATENDHEFVLCSSTGKKINTAYTILQAKAVLSQAGVDVSDWGELSNVRDVRTACLRKVADETGLAHYINEAVKEEQRERGLPGLGLQDMTNNQLLSIWDLLIRTGRTSEQQVAKHYTKATRSHTEMAELLELVRKHFVDGLDSPPVRTDFVEKTGRRFPKTSEKQRNARSVLPPASSE